MLYKVLLLIVGLAMLPVAFLDIAQTQGYAEETQEKEHYLIIHQFGNTQLVFPTHDYELVGEGNALQFVNSNSDEITVLSTEGTMIRKVDKDTFATALLMFKFQQENKLPEGHPEVKPEVVPGEGDRRT